jgi:hypothetical protein
MKYLKTYESYYQPAWVTYLSNLNKEEGLEIAEFLEEMLGTKETPLNVYDGSSKNYINQQKFMVFHQMIYDLLIIIIRIQKRVVLR